MFREAFHNHVNLLVLLADARCVNALPSMRARAESALMFVSDLLASCRTCMLKANVTHHDSNTYFDSHRGSSKTAPGAQSALLIVQASSQAYAR